MMVDQTIDENKPVETEPKKEEKGTIFDKGEQKPNNPDQGSKPELGNDYKTKLSEITNEEGAPKYSSVEDALNALKNSQEHIKKLEKENADYRTNLEEAKTMEDLLSAINNSENNQNVESNIQQSASVNSEDFKSIAMQVIAEKEAADLARNNQAQVAASLTDKYGEKAREMYTAKANELGISIEDLNMLAARSPKAVNAYFDSPSKDDKNIKGTVNTASSKWTSPTAPTESRKDLMFGASKQDIQNAWREAERKVLEQYK